ncbi:MAG: hypothetical protein OHK0039_41380 [Bacteroidia bacterium]
MGLDEPADALHAGFADISVAWGRMHRCAPEAALNFFTMTDYRPVADSRTVLTELMIPAYANFGGKVHGGIILSLMDKVAYVCASKHARTYCVTASVDNVDFRSPVEVGDMVSLFASVNYTGRSSMEVGIRTEAHNIRSGTIKHTNTSYFTMVALGEDGRPSSVPGLILQSETDVRRFLEAMERRRLARDHREAIRDIKTLLLDDERLAGEKCRIAIDQVQ